MVFLNFLFCLCFRTGNLEILLVCKESESVLLFMRPPTKTHVPALLWTPHQKGYSYVSLKQYKVSISITMAILCLQKKNPHTGDKESFI